MSAERVTTRQEILAESFDLGIDAAPAEFARRIAARLGVELIAISSTTGDPLVQAVRFRSQSPSQATGHLAIDFGRALNGQFGAGAQVHLTLERPLEEWESSLVSTSFVEFYTSSIQNSIEIFRQEAVANCLGADDPDSLAKRIRNLSKEYSFAEGVAVYVIDRAEQFLQLQSSTSISERLQKKSAAKVFLTEENELAAKCYRDQKLIRVKVGEGPGEGTFTSFPERRYDVHNQYFFPIKVRHTHRASTPQVLGCVRITNTAIKNAGDVQNRRMPQPLSWEDQYVLEFMMEQFYIYLSGVYAVERSRRRFDRATHSIDIAADASLHLARSLKQKLLKSDDDSSSPPIAPDLLGPTDTQWLRNQILALEAHLEDLNEQIMLNSGLDVAFHTPFAKDSKIDNVANEILRPLVRMAPRVAIVHGLSRSPAFNRVDEAVTLALRNMKTSKLPAIYGRPNHILSVFRNLLDNSVKYSGNRRVLINLTLQIGSDDLEIIFADDGPGISEVDRPRLFTEGLRGRKAWRVSNRGLGIGLSSCREILGYYGGSIALVDSQRGAAFKLSLPLIK